MGQPQGLDCSWESLSKHGCGRPCPLVKTWGLASRRHLLATGRGPVLLSGTALTKEGSPGRTLPPPPPAQPQRTHCMSPASFSNGSALSAVLLLLSWVSRVSILIKSR